MKDFLPQWLEDAHAEADEKADRYRAAYDTLKCKTTKYAKGILHMAQIQSRVADIWLNAMNDHYLAAERALAATKP